MKTLCVSIRRFASAAGALALLSTAGTALGAQVSITPPSKDFGVVALQQSRFQDFTIQNTTARRDTVQISTSSPCVTLNKTSVAIEPGQSGTVRVTVKTAAPGLCQSTITASAGAFSATAAVSAQVTNVSISPQSIVFQKLNIGQSSSQTVNVKNEGPATLNCQFVPGTFGAPSAGHANFTVVPASVSVGPNQQVPVTIRFSAVSLQGLTDELGVSKSKFTVLLAVTCGPAVSSRPASLTGEFNLLRVNIGAFRAVAGKGISAQVSGDQASAIGGGVKCGGFIDLQGNPNAICSGLVAPGAQVTAIAAGAGFKSWTNGQGSAANCNNTTGPSCTFNVTSDAIGLTANF